jgi:hypothetical protein
MGRSDTQKWVSIVEKFRVNLKSTSVIFWLPNSLEIFLSPANYLTTNAGLTREEISKN